MGSMIVRITSCTSLSFIEGIPKGLNLPGFPGLGISISLTPVHEKLLVKTASLISNIFFLVIESIIPSSGPGVSAPLLLFSER